MMQPFKLDLFIVGICTYLVSGDPLFLKCLLVIAIFESFSKIRLEIKQNKCSLVRVFRAMIGKIWWYFAIIVVATQIDYIAGSLNISWWGKKLASNITIILLAIVDATRFIENLKAFGVHVPNVLILLISKLKDIVNGSVKLN